MPAPSESLVALEQQLAAALIRFDELDAALPLELRWLPSASSKLKL